MLPSPAMDTNLPPDRARIRNPWRNRALTLGLVVAVMGSVLGVIYGMVSPGHSTISIGGPFELVDSAGHSVTNRSWPGKFLLVYFGYTYCPDVCPTTLTTLTGALAKLGSRADDVQPLFITVDPKRDTPAVLAGYTAAFSPKLVGLTGSPEQIAQVAREYRVYYAEHRTGPGPDDYLMDHSSIIYIISPDGRFLSVLPADQPVDSMAAQILEHISAAS